MRKVNRSKLKEGMVLAEPITGPSGELILPKGSTLNAKSIELIERRDVPSVTIEGDEEDVLSKYPRDYIVAIRDEVQGKFLPASLQIDWVQTVVVKAIEVVAVRRMPNPIQPEPSSETTTATPSAPQEAPAVPTTQTGTNP